MRLRLVRALAAVLLGAAAGVVGAAPAHAAACAPGTGVTVVIGSSVGCDADGGGRAADNVAAAGHSLKYASRAPGFVCRVDGAPASDPCVDASPADAYWGLFWSDGESGSWVYSSLGVTALRVPTGGAVAFVFQDSSTKTFPSVEPPVAATPAPEPTTGSGGRTTKSPRPKGSKKPSKSSAAPAAPAAGGAVAPAAGAPSAATPGTVPTATPSPTAAPSATAAPTTGDAIEAAEGSGTSVQPLGSQTEESGTSTPALVAAGVVVVLIAAGGGIAWRRRSGV